MTGEEFDRQYLDGLTKEQKEAVHAVKGQFLLLAVPGSGKTTVLVKRLGYMIRCLQIPPENILAITYTVAAANDCRRRYLEEFGEDMQAVPEFRTINGLCAMIISAYGRRIGKEPFSLLSDEREKNRILSEIYQKETCSYPSESDLKELNTQITYIKNMQISGKEIGRLVKERDLPLQKIFEEYEKVLRERSLMDYDDQMVYALRLLRKIPALLEFFRKRFLYICVDEAQDTSKIQHEIIDLLAGEDGDLFLVGDEDQSIYGFRAAYPDALLNMKKRYPKARILLMEENFRSGSGIVKAADNFIQKNRFRHKKSMHAANDTGSDVKILRVKARSAQYTYLLKAVSEPEERTAVLFRENEQVLPLIDLLERNRVPYTMRSSEWVFFTHRVVSDIRSILQFACNTRDTELFLQIYYKLNLYIDKENANRICDIASHYGISVFAAAKSVKELPQRIRERLSEFRENCEKLAEESAKNALFRITSLMGYSDYLERAHISDNKIPILKAIASNETGVREFLDRLTELSEIVKNREYDPDCPLVLSTIHSSKGLEYDTVYLMDVCDGIFPERALASEKEWKAASDEERRAYEEERRIFYVGITRARTRLYLFDLHGDSAFIRDMAEAGERKSEVDNTKKMSDKNNRRKIK